MSAWAVSLYRKAVIFLGLCLVSVEILAQALPMERFHSDEELNMKLYFKWGVIMAKAGDTKISITESQYEGKPAWRYNLLFKTLGMFEKVYSMRDTMNSYFSKDNGLLLFGNKHANEKDYYLIDEWRFSYLNEKTSVLSKRYTPTRVKIDTTLVADGKTYDMLSATLLLRSLDWNDLKMEEAVPFCIAIGRDLVNAAFRYTGQEIIERGNIKYRTRHFYIDVFDDAFTQSRAAGEAWIGDDSNHVPIKIRAKLKIGAAEVFFESAKNLKYPFTCGIPFR